MRRRDAVGGAEAVHAFGHVAERAARDDRRAPDGVDILEAECSQRGRGDREQLRVGVGARVEVDADLRQRDAEALRGDARRELARLAHDQVRPPVLDRRRAFPGARRARRAR